MRSMCCDQHWQSWQLNKHLMHWKFCQVLRYLKRSASPKFAVRKIHWHKQIEHQVAWNKFLASVIFLHNRPWISPWIKSISNELDITIHVITSHLFRYYDVISNRLWRHQQQKDRASETRGRCLYIVVFIVIYVFVMSCKKQNNVCTLATRAISTKITHSWALKQFVTRVHTLFSIYSLCLINNTGYGIINNETRAPDLP